MVGYMISMMLTFNASYHPLHVSLLNIDYSTNKPTINLAFKVFTNDIEFAIAHDYNVLLSMGKPNENPDAQRYINTYVSNTFKLVINKNYQPKLVYKSKEINEDAVWLHYDIPINTKIKELVIRNAILMDVYDNQVNLVIIAINGNEKGYQLTSYDQEVNIKL
jgi:hypothetical protein